MTFEEQKHNRSWIAELKIGQCHVVTFAEVGLSSYSSCCEFAYGMMQSEQQVYADKVNALDETGTMYPRANITILPLETRIEY